MFRRMRVISIDISIGKFQDFVNYILYMAEKRKSSYVCAANVHMTIEAHANKSFQRIVNNADLVTADGMPIVKALKLLYNIEQERVAGPVLMEKLIFESEKLGLSVYFYGSTRKVLNLLKERLILKHPKLKVAGMYSPPFRELKSSEKEEIVANINDSRANIVFVSLGCPKQEKWMAEMKGKINAVMIGVGAAFPIFAGIRRRAPVWMQKLYLEWFYRLLQEPRRLAGRYLYTNSKFIYLMAKEIVKIDRRNV